MKKSVKNKFRVEGCIIEAYLVQEISHFSSHYFESHVLSSNNKIGRNDVFTEKYANQPTLSVFNPSGRTYDLESTRWLDDKEVAAAQLHVLINCDDVKPFLK